jgi:hypothetical protein
MKTFLRATAAAALFMIPGISAASSLDYVQSGSNYTVMFDPNGSGTDSLPPSFYYRSYDVRRGGKPVVVTDLHVVTPPSNPGGTPPPPTQDVTPPPSDGGTTPIITNTTPPPDTGTTTSSGSGKCDGNMAAVPAPASSEIAGAGLAVIALASWQRSRRQARA